MTTRTSEATLRIVRTVAELHPGAHPITLAWECRRMYDLEITGKEVERILRHNSTER